MKIAIIAGESSGDMLGAALMSQLHGASFVGIGGEAMAGQGLQSLFPMNELSLMGVIEILPKIYGLLQRVKETVKFVIDGEFDALITIDSPDFCFRVAKKVKKLRSDLPIIHYVAPSVWAWRPGRAKKISAFIDHVLCLLPFEPKYMIDAGMSADFVGHPVADRKAPDAASLRNWQAKNGPVIGLFPGSRHSEMKHHLAVYAQAWKELSTTLPHQLHIPVYDHVREAVRDAFEGLPRVNILSPRLIGFDKFQEQKSMVMHGAEFAIATSGTVSFELAWADTPVIVGYQTGKITQYIFKRMASVKYASLTNILADREIIPELIFENFNAGKLVDLAKLAASDPSFASDQRAGFSQIREMMKAKLDAGASVAAFLDTRL